VSEDGYEDGTEHDQRLGVPAAPPPPASTPTLTPVSPPGPFAGTVPAGVVWPIAGPPPTPSEGAYPDLFPPVAPLPLLVILPERAKQRRWTVLLRGILAIPLEVVVIAVGIAAAVCVVLGWFAALVLGRAPEFVRTIVTVYLRMILRLEAYLFFLTDRFPPFSVDEAPEYHARLAVPPATPLNRAAVLFRLILVIPASIAVRIVGLGVYVVAFFAWFAVLITGWLPKPVHEVFQVFTRYELRVVAYLGLLVPTYPGEVFGDLSLPVPVIVPGGDPFGADAVPSELPPQPPPPQPWMLVLSMGAKRFLLVTIVLGVAAAIGLAVLETSLQSHENLVQVNNQLVSNLNQFATTANNCQSVSCLENANAVLSGQLGSFVSAIENSDHAGVSQDLVNGVTSAAQNAERVTQALAQAGPTLSDYQSAVKRLDAVQTITALVDAQHAFVTAVNASRFG
jgi:hypothetical protein